MEQPEVVSPQQEQVEVTDDDRLWALLSWILTPIVPIIVLLLEDKKARPFIKYHAVHALIVGGIGYLISVVLSTLLVGCLLGLALFVYLVYLAIQAYNGQWVTVPLVTDFIKDQGWL